jgi:hypothetical protein
MLLAVAGEDKHSPAADLPAKFRVVGMIADRPAVGRIEVVSLHRLAEEISRRAMAFAAVLPSAGAHANVLDKDTIAVEFVHEMAGHTVSTALRRETGCDAVLVA